MGGARRLREKQERLWASKCVELQYRLLVMNEIRSLMAEKPNNIINFRGLPINRLLSAEAIEELRCRCAVRTRFLIGVTFHCFQPIIPAN